MGGISYLDFDLLIQRAEGQYRAQADSPAGQAAVTFSLPFTDIELENFLLRVGRTRRVTRRIDSPEVKAAKDFGERLFSAIFTDEVRGCLRSSIEEARRQGGGLRIRLHLTGAPELADLPWEYLYNPALNRFLSLSVDTPVVRYLDLPERIQPLLVSPPLQLLVMISSPHDYPALEVEQEWGKLRDALGELVQRGLVSLERLPEPRLSTLQRYLRRGTYHIFHFIGHGGFDANAQDGVLVLEDEDGRGRQVSGQDLGLMLHDHRSMRLAVLNACEGARTSRTDPFAGTAQSLVQQGLAAVIAMQFEITDEAAITFAHEFYGAVADAYPVDAALVEARKAIFAGDNGLEWGTPVLYLRAPDGRIFDVERARETPVTRGETSAAVTVESREPPQPSEVHPAFQVSLSQQAVTVAPGRSADVAVTIHNVSPRDDRYRVEVSGVDPGWIRMSTADSAVAGRAQGQLTMTIAPPQAPKSRAGTFQASITVKSQQSSEEVTADVAITVAAVLAYTVSLTPPVRSSRFEGRFVVTVENVGNAPIALSLTAGDVERAAAFEFKTDAPVVPPGERVEIPLAVKPGRLRLMGRARSHQFTVTVRPLAGDLPPQTARGEFVHRPVIPAWAPAAAGLLLALLAGVALRGTLQVPVIEQFAAEPAVVVQDGAVALRWRVSNARSIAITPSVDSRAPDPQQGQVSVRPSSRGTQTFTLVARGRTRSVEQSVTVTVKMRPPSIKSFGSAPERGGGRRLFLSWEVVDATEARIDPQPGPVRLKGSILVDLPPPNQPVTYRLTASNPDNPPVEKVLAVAAVPHPPVVSRFEAQPSEVRTGQQTVLSWNVPGAEAATISGIGAVRVPSGSAVVRPQSTERYTLTASNPHGSVTQGLTVRVRPVNIASSPQPTAGTIPRRTVASPRVSTPTPQVSPSLRTTSAEVREFSATPVAVTSGETTQLCWSTLNAQGGRIEPDIGDVDPRDLAKGCRSISPKQTTTFTLTATGADGRTASAQVTVEVRPPEVHVDLTAAKVSLITGESTQLCWLLFNARSARLDPGIGDLPPSELEKGCRAISPRQTTTYTLTVVGRDGRTVTRQLTVDVRVVEVQIREFVVRTAVIRPGDTTQLCWVVVNARSVRIDPEPGELGRQELEKGCREISPRQTTRYFMTAVGPDGRTVTQSVLVVVALR